MSMIVFIPARAGSKSITDKNTKELGGKPLVAWSIESALEAGIEKVIVNSDGEDILNIAKEAGATIMSRPASLAKDKTSMFELLKSEIAKITPLPDIVMLLQPTVPFRSKFQIRLAIQMLEANQEYDSVILVERIPEKYHPMLAIVQSTTGNRVLFAKVKKWWGGKKYEGPILEGVPISQRVTRRQDHANAWVPTGSIYLFKTKNLGKGSFYGDRVMLVETEPSININDQKDWDEAEEWIKKNQS